VVIGEMEGKIWNTENPNMLNWIWIWTGLGSEEVRQRRKMAEI